jgi:sugar phosphate permease
MKSRNLVLLILCAMYFIAYVDRVNISVAGPAIRKDLALSATQLGLIFSAFAYSYAGMQIFGGWLSDELGPRLVLAVLSTIWAGATMMTGLSWSVASLVACRVLLGVGEGGAFPAATRALAHWLPVKERGFAQGITHTSARLGNAVTGPIVIAIVASSGWRASFLVLGVASLAWTVVWILFFTNTPAEHRWVTAAELAEIGDQPDPRQNMRRRKTPWKELVKRMWLVTVVDFCYGWSLWVFLTWLPSYLVEARGFALDRMAAMTALPLLAGGVGDTLGGVASDMLFKRSGNLRLARSAVLVVGLTGAFAFIVPAILTRSPLLAVCNLAIAFFFLELTNPVLWTLPLDIAGEHAGTAGGMMNTGFGVAGMISPVVFGVLIQRTGNYRLPFFVSAGLLLVGALCAFRIDATKTIAPALESRGQWKKVSEGIPHVS